MVDSVPVVIASDQSAILVNVQSLPAVTGIVSVTQGTTPWVVSGTVAVTQSGAWTTGRTWTLSSGTDSISSVQGTSPWVSNVSQFGGSNVVTGTGTSGAGIPRVTISNDSSLAANQSVNVNQWGGSSTTLGQKVSASSVPVVIASDQSAININNISGTVSLPTGASTSANQTNGSQKTQVVDGSGNVWGPVTTLSGVNYQPVVLAASGTTGAAVPSRTIQVGGSDGANLQTLSVDTSGHPQVVGSVASAATDSGNPVKIGAKFNTTLPTVTNGQRVDGQANAFGELAVRSRNKYLNIVGNTTTTVKSGAGVLSCIIVNNGANGTTLTIYDNTTATGTKIGTVAVLGINTNVMSNLTYDCEFATGLTIVTAGSAANDITVMYQ